MWSLFEGHVMQIAVRTIILLGAKNAAESIQTPLDNPHMVHFRFRVRRSARSLH